MIDTVVIIKFLPHYIIILLSVVVIIKLSLRLKLA